MCDVHVGYDPGTRFTPLLSLENWDGMGYTAHVGASGGGDYERGTPVLGYRGGVDL